MGHSRVTTFSSLSLAPLCMLLNGTMASVEDGLADMPPPIAAQANCDADRVYYVEVDDSDSYVKIAPMKAGSLSELKEDRALLLLRADSGQKLYLVALEFMGIQDDLYVFRPVPRGRDEAMKHLRSADTLQFSSEVSCQTFKLDKDDNVFCPKPPQQLASTLYSSSSNNRAECKPRNPRVYSITNMRR